MWATWFKQPHHCEACPLCATFCTPAMPATPLHWLSRTFALPGWLFGNTHELVLAHTPAPLSVLAKSKACTQTVGPAPPKKKAICLKIRKGIYLIIIPCLATFYVKIRKCQHHHTPPTKKTSCGRICQGHATKLGASASICRMVDANLAITGRTKQGQLQS